MSDENYMAFWKGYRLAKENEKSKKEAVKAEMNKKQLIDKAIDEMHVANLDKLIDFNKGKWAAPYDICECNGDILGIFTREEFEARKAERDALTSGVEIADQALKELGLEKTIINKQWQIDAIESKIEEIKSREWVDELIATTNHWYDYKNQKALRLPPVGEAVQMVTNLDKVRIVAHDNGFAVYWCEWLAEYQHTDAYELFRPLDWDKRNTRAELTQLIESHGNLSVGQLADSILAAGYRKCDNKTTSTQEQWHARARLWVKCRCL